MRILHYLPCGTGGQFGTANAVRAWCSAMTLVGLDVAVVVDEAAVRAEPDESPILTPIRHHGRPHIRLASPAAVRSLGRADLLVLHGGWNPQMTWMARLASRRGIPYVITAHGVYHPRVWVRRRVRKRIYGLLAERRYVRDALAVHLFFEDEEAELPATSELVFAPNPVHMDPPVRWSGGGGYVLWYGRYDIENKGLDVLLEAVAGIPPSSRPRLLLHGIDARGGRGRLEHVASRLGLQKHVSIRGPIYGRDKWRCLAECDGFVYPSRWDGCPTAVIEAALVGAPVLTGPFPLGRALAAAHAGMSVPSNPAMMREALVTMLGGEGRAFAAHASHLVRELFHPRRLADVWLRQVQGLLQPKKSATTVAGH